MTETKFETYLFSYHHNGSEWGFEIQAESEEDARERVNKLPLARYDGVLYAKIPAGMGWFARLVCWFNNRFKQ